MFPILQHPSVPFKYKTKFFVNPGNGAKSIFSTAQNYLSRILYVCHIIIYLSPKELLNKEKREEGFVLWFSKFVHQT